MARAKKYTISILALILSGFLLPERIAIPVSGASRNDWNPQSFWFEPWGTSGVHKGIDIFARNDTPVVSATDGLVLYAGETAKGGKVVIILGPKWRLHYYAHLNAINTHTLGVTRSGKAIGTVGDTGNARGKPAHLHYSITRIFPAPWKIDDSTQGYKKAFYLDPGAFLDSRQQP